MAQRPGPPTRAPRLRPPQQRDAVRALFYGDAPHRLAGAQQSLLAALTRAGEFGLDPHLVFPAPGVFEQACRDGGLRVTVLPAPPAFQSFGKALLEISWTAQ